MPFLRNFQYLLPSGKAWQIVASKTLRSFFVGLTGVFSDARTFTDEIYEDLHPDTTRELAEWEKQFGLQPSPSTSEADRRLALAAEWAATGGQSPGYIEGVLQTAGFDVYIHEWWSSGPAPYVARDPRLYTTQPLIGTYQCRADPAQPQCAASISAPQCNRFLANDPGYLLNKTGVPNAPPPVPDDSDFWPYFLYFGGATFGTTALVPNDRKAEFIRLLLKLSPMNNWIVTIVDYTTAGVFDASFDASFE